MEAQNQQDQKVDEIRQMVLAKVQGAETIQITDREELTVANTIVLDLRSAEKRIDQYWDPLIEKAKETKKKAEETRKGLADEKARMKSPVEAARKTIERRIADYISLEEERRRVESEKARREAQSQDDDARILLAEEAIEAGNPHLADSILEGIAHVPSTAVGPPSVKEDLEGIGTFDYWYAEIINPHQVIKAWLEGKAPAEVVEINQGKLDAYAKLMKNHFDVPGAIAKKEIRIKGKRT